MRVDEHVAEMSYENLFHSNIPVPEVFRIDLRSGQGKLKRGTALAKGTNLEMVMLGSEAKAGETLTANCVLAESVDTGNEAGTLVTGLAYRIGHFNGNVIAVKEGYNITGEDKEQFRSVGILLSDAF